MSARAKVRVELMVHVPDAWGDDCTLGQMRAQAAESALGMLANADRAAEGIRRGQIQIISSDVTVVLYDGKSRE